MNCSAQQVAEWINTQDYKTKNFERKDLVINPVKACQPLGALLCALGIEGCLPFVHGSQGCAAYFRNFLVRHYREPISAVSDSMTEDAAVFGGQTNLLDGLLNAYTLYKPKMIAVFTSCMAEVIGDDLKSYLDNARNKKAIPEDFPVALAHTPSFKGSHITGYDNMLRGLLESLALPRQDVSDLHLYLVPGFDPYPANLREYKRLLNYFGISYTILPDHSDVVDSPNTGKFAMYPGGTPYNELINALNASDFLFLQSYSTSSTTKYVKNIVKIPTETVRMPIGITNTDQLLTKIAEIAGKEVPPELQAERGRAVDAMTDAHPYIHGKKFAMFGDPDILLGVTGFLLEMGGIPVHIICTNGTRAFAKDMETLLASSPDGQKATVYLGKDLWHLRSLLLTDPVDMLIGDTHGKIIAREAQIPLVRLGIPIMDRVNLHRYPIVGYSGVMNLITMIANTFLEEKDRTSSDAYFELMR